MTTFHTELPEDTPGFHGEYLVGKSLQSFKDDQIEAWFQVDYLPAVTDLDVVLFHPEAGLFLLETKGMKIESIETYSLTEFVLFPRTKKQHPVEQVRTGQHRLKNFLEDLFRRRGLKLRVPFIQTSVVWPQITRGDWNSRFGDQRIQLQAKSMLFKDDLATTKSLIARLKLLKESPLLGAIAIKDPIPSSETIDAVREALTPIGELKNRNDTLTEEIRRAVVHSKQLALTYPPPKKYDVVFEGPPGTGKSTVLREIGLLHAVSGGTVLHVCYNKALAADQRREYEVLKTYGIEYGSIDVFDEWELYKAVHPSWDAYTGKDAERRYKWEYEVAQEIIEARGKPDSHPTAIYDTILIDESQDLSDSIFQVLDYLARPTASWFVSFGAGQEIFSFNKENPSPFLKNWLEKAERKRLRRSFRNSTRAFLMAQNFWENYPKFENCSEWFDQKLSLNKNSESTMELELEIPSDTNDFKITRLSSDENRLISVKQLILEVIESAKSARRGSDVLIVVGEPYSKSKAVGKTSYELVTEALSELQPLLTLDILDLIPWVNRRNTPKEGTIRIARYQNIRGLSASHVVLFDFAELEEWCNQVKQGVSQKKGSLNNYGYIAFSRSRVSTTVVLDKEKSHLENFIENSLVMVREKFLAYGAKLGRV
jgi:hypothetical protein